MIGDESRAGLFSRVASAVACGVLAADLVFIVVTGGLSLLSPGSLASDFSFAVRIALLVVAITARFRLFTKTERRLSAGQLMLMLSLCPALFHLQTLGRRITGDALYYYVFTRSMVRDADLDFTNEFDHYGLLKRRDFAVPTSTGHRRTIYAVGPGLLWTPFFVAADGLAYVMEKAGFGIDKSGYGPLNLNAVALGSFSFGVLGLFLIHAFLQRDFGDRFAAGAVILLCWASFFPWYLAEQPLTSHPASVLLVAAFFLLRQNGVLAFSRGSFAIGLALGIAMSVRWQNGVYLLLPAVDFLIELRRGVPVANIVKRGLWLALAVFLGALPQMLAWKAIFNLYILPYPPQGTDFVRFSRPFFLNTLFSSRHGLLSWTPVFWFCLIGLFLLTKKSPRRFGILWAPVVIVTIVNSSTGDWWAGGAFSNRRFDSLLPVFALGLAGFLGAAITFVRRHPACAPLSLAFIAAIWNVTFMRAVQSGDAPTGIPLSLPSRALASTRSLSRDVGFPTTWPASWIFAWRFHASPGAFDLAAGKYLFYRQNNLQGVAELGSPGDDALILDGFSPPRRNGAAPYRTIDSVGRLVVSLDEPQPLDVIVRARARDAAVSTVEIFVNDRVLGSARFEGVWGEGRVHGAQSVWRRGPNVVTLRSSGRVDLDRVKFVVTP